jgi:hypothetical protein
MQRIITFLMILLTVSATVQQASAADITQQLQTIMGKKNSPNAMGQMIVVGSLLGCTQKTAGKEAVNTLYQKMQNVGKTIQGYCNQGKAEDARKLLLQTMHQQHNNQVVSAGLDCYDGQAQNLAALAGADMATNAARYAKWLRAPDLADSEVKTTDICRPKQVK